MAEIRSSATRKVQVCKNIDKTLEITSFEGENNFAFIMLIITFNNSLLF